MEADRDPGQGLGAGAAVIAVMATSRASAQPQHSGQRTVRL